MSIPTPVVLSPDLTQFWDGTRWLPALLSPDGRQVRTGAEWLPVSDGRGPRRLTETRAYVAACTVCGSAATLVMLVGAVLEQRLIVLPFGVVLGGTLLLALGLAGFFGDSLLRAAGRPEMPAERAEMPEAAAPGPVQVVLSEDGRMYWDGADWRPVVQISDDGRHAWNGREWLAVTPSHPAQPPV